MKKYQIFLIAVLGVVLSAAFVLSVLPLWAACGLLGAVTGLFSREICVAFSLDRPIRLKWAEKVHQSYRLRKARKLELIRIKQEEEQLLRADFSNLLNCARIQQGRDRWETGRRVGVLKVDVGLMGRKGQPVFFDYPDDPTRDWTVVDHPWHQKLIDLVNKDREDPTFFSLSTPTIGVPLSAIFTSPTFPDFSTAGT